MQTDWVAESSSFIGRLGRISVRVALCAQQVVFFFNLGRGRTSNSLPSPCTAQQQPQLLLCSTELAAGCKRV